MAEDGKITQVMGPVVDVEFPPEDMPAIYNALETKIGDGKLVLEVDRLSKSFDGETVFADLGFTLTRGDKLAVVGPNGVGKTTLLKCLASVYEPDRGKIRLGHEVSWTLELHSEAIDGGAKTRQQLIARLDSKIYNPRQLPRWSACHGSCGPGVEGTAPTPRAR